VHVCFLSLSNKVLDLLFSSKERNHFGTHSIDKNLEVCISRSICFRCLENCHVVVICTLDKTQDHIILLLFQTIHQEEEKKEVLFQAKQIRQERKINKNHNMHLSFVQYDCMTKKCQNNYKARNL